MIFGLKTGKTEESDYKRNSFAKNQIAVNKRQTLESRFSLHKSPNLKNKKKIKNKYTYMKTKNRNKKKKIIQAIQSIKKKQ